jgi:hypothetical protein
MSGYNFIQDNILGVSLTSGKIPDKSLILSQQNIPIEYNATQVITQDLFPLIYSVDIPEPIIDRRLNIPGVYSYYGFPEDVTKYVDPKYISGPQKYEYRYNNQNGIDVVIRGTYNHVMSVIDVLNTYPPTINDKSEPSKKFFPLNSSNLKQPMGSIPSIGIQDNGSKHMFVKMDNKVFSGSGSLIMVVEDGQASTAAKFVLFRNTKSGYFEELGGKIDKPTNTTIDANILFTNCKKESEEESMKLFNLNNVSPVFVDIQSTLDNTFYRVYVYLFKINNIEQLSSYYNHNRDIVLRSNNFTDADRETDILNLFDYQSFISKLGDYNAINYDIKNGVFRSTTGRHVEVDGRTIKVISHLINNNILSDIINKNKFNPSNLQISSNSDQFNRIIA